MEGKEHGASRRRRPLSASGMKKPIFADRRLRTVARNTSALITKQSVNTGFCDLARKLHHNPACQRELAMPRHCERDMAGQHRIDELRRLQPVLFRCSFRSGNDFGSVCRELLHFRIDRNRYDIVSVVLGGGFTGIGLRSHASNHVPFIAGPYLAQHSDPAVARPPFRHYRPRASLGHSLRERRRGETTYKLVMVYCGVHRWRQMKPPPKIVHGRIGSSEPSTATRGIRPRDFCRRAFGKSDTTTGISVWYDRCGLVSASLSNCESAL